MNFRDTYRQLYDHISPDEALTKQLLDRAAIQNRKILSMPWQVITAAVFLFCTAFFISIPALAAHIEPVYQFLYTLSPEAAQYLMPVHLTSEDQGIRMEVVSASVEKDTARIYISMEDLNGDRIDQTTDLYDSYSVHRPFPAAETCERAGYDADAKKVYFLITLKEWSETDAEHSIQGEKITFSVKEFLSGKSIYEDIPIALEPDMIPENPAVKKVDPSGLGGSFEDLEDDQGTDVLVPNTSIDILPANGITLTALGYRDGMLHIQTSLENTLENDNHGYLWLENADGKKTSFRSIHFQDETDSSHPVTFVEEIFDINIEELSDYTLHGYFVISGQKTEGNWKVTFPLE